MNTKSTIITDPNLIEFRDPPAPLRGSKATNRYAGVIARLAASPGEWAYLGTATYQSGHLREVARKAGVKLEVTWRTRPDGTFDCYAQAVAS